MKPIDNSKIEKVKKETKILIVEKGYHGASIAELAKRAQVSDGYLYRHYKNKAELVKDVFETQLKHFHDHIFLILDSEKLVRKVVEGIISYLFELVKVEPYALTFAHMLVYDHEFEYPQSRRDAIKLLAEDILHLGRRTGEFSKNIREIDIILTILTIPVKLIEYSGKGYHKKYRNEKKESEMIVTLCMNALK